MRININLQPKQAFFDYLLEHSTASWIGYGGSRGGAKSGSARRSMLRRRIQYPKTNGQIMRRVWDDVEKNHISKMWEEFPDLQPFYKSSTHVIDLPEQLGGGKIYFGSAETVHDVERKAYGPEFMDIFVDQAEQFEERELTQIKTTCRWPGMDEHACKFGLFFNPGGIGAAFLQRIFSTKDFHDREKPEDYAFVQAYGWDNVMWAVSALKADGLTEEDFYRWDDETRFKYYITRTQYGQEMDKLPAHLRLGQLLGDFTKFSGQYFSNWNPSVHVWDPEEIIFQAHWPRWISMDWGFGHHSSIHWHAQAGTKEKPLVITYKELIRQGLSERALAEEIVAANDGDIIGKVFAGHDLWRKEPKGSTKEKAISSVFRAAGLPSLTHAVIERVNGWRHMHTALDEGEWIITSNCKEAVLAMPVAIFDDRPNKEEDVRKTDTLADDVLDDLRYGLYTQAKQADLPEAILIRQQTAHLTDPTNRAMMLTKLISDRKLRVAQAGHVNSHARSRFTRYAARHRQ